MATGRLSFLSHDGIGTLYANTICIHWQAAVAGPDESFSNAVHEAGEWLEAKYLKLLPNDGVLDRIVLRGVGADAGSLAERAYGANSTIGGGDGKLPREVANILSFRTGHAGRSGMGHIALPSPRDSGALTSSGGWDTSTAYWTHVGDFGDALLAGHDWTPLTLPAQHMSARVWSEKDVASYDMTAYIRRPAPRWIQRRQTVP